MFITFEGIEGCGKSTQIRMLASTLASLNLDFVVTREPGGCPISDQIRAILLDAGNSSIIPMTELMLYAAARAQHLAEVVRPALESGRIVLCDRFSDATRAYQAFGREIDSNTVETLNCMACGDIRPDLTILLDCEVETGLARAMKRIDSSSGPREERFEQESVAFHQRVREGYLSIAAFEPDRFAVIDASGSPDDVFNSVRQAVMLRLGLS